MCSAIAWVKKGNIGGWARSSDSRTIANKRQVVYLHISTCRMPDTPQVQDSDERVLNSFLLEERLVWGCTGGIYLHLQ